MDSFPNARYPRKHRRGCLGRTDSRVARPIYYITGCTGGSWELAPLPSTRGPYSQIKSGEH